MTIYHGGNRQLQDEFDTRRLADRLEETVVGHVIGEREKSFIEGVDMFFLATADAEGRPNCSYKGGDPGFVTVVDERTIAFPIYDGNGMFLSMGNVAANAHVGILFIDFAKRRRIRLNGVASVDRDDPLLARYPEAQLVVRVALRELFPNCPRYIHHYELVDRSEYVPRDGCQTPEPEWKQQDWAKDVLPQR